jgi:mRNA deadenylase 3'-5' endonuclease subunit Ccr4
MRMEGHPDEDKSLVVDSEYSHIDVSHCFPRIHLGTKLFSAAGIPKFTNYTAGFKDLLDYVYIERCFEVIRIAPFPEEEVLAEDTALPSMYFPSDHMAVVVDVRLR